MLTGWPARAADVVVIGGGIAGCAAALSAAHAGAGEVLVLTELPDPEEANTRYTQGGIIYDGPDDSPELLAEDVLQAGARATAGPPGCSPSKGRRWCGLS